SACCLSIRTSARVSRIHVKSGRGEQGWGIPEACWLASLAKLMSFRSRERPCLKKGTWRLTKERPLARHTFIGICTSTHMCMSTPHTNHISPVSLFPSLLPSSPLNTTSTTMTTGPRGERSDEELAT
ncbi:mCG145066, partial [Mus musculus]